MFISLNKFQIVLILTLLTFSISAYPTEFSPTTFTPDFQKKPTYGCKSQYGTLACRWEGECADLGRICASCAKGFSYNGTLHECYKCPSGYSLNGQLMCS